MKVFLDRSIAVITSSKLLLMRTILAASIAMSVPAPMAIPTSAAAYLMMKSGMDGEHEGAMVKSQKNNAQVRENH